MYAIHRAFEWQPWCSDSRILVKLAEGLITMGPLVIWRRAAANYCCSCVI